MRWITGFQFGPVGLSVLVLLLCFATPASAIVTAFSNYQGTVFGSSPVADGVDLNGVVEIVLNGIEGPSGCSGSLLSDGFSILTAAHCVNSAYGATLPTSATVTFLGPSGSASNVTDSVSAYAVDPLWNGTNSDGGDLAVLRLATAAPAFATEYSLYTGPAPLYVPPTVSNPNPPSVPVVIAGYGLTGTGVTGATSGFGTLRVGTNEYINTGQLVGYAPDMLVGQFYESGVSGTNALGVAIPYTSSDEVDIASGDSGGPTFYDGQIVGVHDVSGCLGSGCSLNSVFGDTFGDTATDEAMSMSTSETNATWIEDQEVGQAPEPASSALLGLGLVFLAAQRFRSAPSRRRLAGK